MGPTTGLCTQVTAGLILAGAFLFCAPGGRAQGASQTRLPAGVRYGNALPGLDPLVVIQSQAQPAARVKPLAESISVHELLVPAAAVKEFQRSQKAVRSGDFRSAAEHLEKAIRIYPGFVQAYNNLGASYIQLNEYENAATEFRKAIALDARLQEPYRNLGLSLFLLRRYPEAEIAARQAMQLDPQRSPAWYTLGRILAAEGSASAEAEQLLRQSLDAYPDARLPLAQVLLNRGATQEAAGELHAYLRSAKRDQAKEPAVRCWLSRITDGNDNARSCTETGHGS